MNSTDDLCQHLALDADTFRSFQDWAVTARGADGNRVLLGTREYKTFGGEPVWKRAKQLTGSGDNRALVRVRVFNLPVFERLVREHWDAFAAAAQYTGPPPRLSASSAQVPAAPSQLQQTRAYMAETLQRMLEDGLLRVHPPAAGQSRSTLHLHERGKLPVHVGSRIHANNVYAIGGWDVTDATRALLAGPYETPRRLAPADWIRRFVRPATLPLTSKTDALYLGNFEVSASIGEISR